MQLADATAGFIREMAVSVLYLHRGPSLSRTPGIAEDGHDLAMRGWPIELWGQAKIEVRGSGY